MLFIYLFIYFTDPATIGPRWTRWLNSFELYADGKGLIVGEATTAATKQRRRAMLLHLAGPDLQEIFTTLPDTGEATDYTRAVEALKAYFVPQVNSAFARQTFHQITQKPGETVQQFATRLKKAAKDCDFGADTDNQIRDAVLNKCTSTYIKRKLLEEGQGLNLKRTLEVAEQCEKIETQLAALSIKGEELENINRVNERGSISHTSTQGRPQGRDKTCYRCPWVNPVVIVPKNNGEIRLCIDMRQANRAIMRRRYPIPTVDEVLHTMNGSKVFSKLDLKWGYHQLELSPESREITTFATPDGLFRYKRLLFGVCSASEQYQHEIATVLAGIEGAENISDDIVVDGPDAETRDQRLRQTIERLRDCGLTLNAEKCLFNMDRLVFMGMLLSETGIGPTEDRVKAVLEAGEPTSTTEVRSFLGLANYSSRFIPHFATLSEPLRRLTRIETPFNFGPEQKKSFESLKQKMAEACTLAYFDKNAPTKIITDASPVVLGAVLVQEQGGVWTPVCYASRSLTDCEQRYSQTEKEALGVVWACERFHAYVYGMKFIVETDHKPLETIYGPRSRPCARIERWVLRLQPYDFNVMYRPGRGNIADSLSRLLHRRVELDKHEHDAEEYVRFVAVNATPTALTTREIEEASAVDEELIEVRKAITKGQFDGCKQYMAVAGGICIIGQLVLRGTRIIIPKKLQPRTLALAHEGHLGVVGTKQNLRTKVWWPGMDKAVNRHCRTCHGCQLVARPDPPEPIRSTPLPDGPWQDLAVDLMGPLPSGHSLLVIVDYYSRFYEVEIMQSTTAEKVIDCLADTFSRHELPITIKSDNGPQFRSSEFR